MAIIVIDRQIIVFSLFSYSYYTIVPCSEVSIPSLNLLRKALTNGRGKHLGDGDYNFACSSRVRSLNGGPLRLPSLQTIGPLTVSSPFNLHFCLSSTGAFPSKQSAIYRPNIGKNLNPLSSYVSSTQNGARRGAQRIRI